MIKKLFILALSISFINNATAQINEGGIPLSQKTILSNSVASIQLEKVSTDWIKAAEQETAKTGSIEKIAQHIPTNFSLTNSGTWETLPNGDRLWRLQITATDALGLNPMFENFFLPTGAKLYIYRPDYQQILGAYTAANNHHSKQFATEIIFGNSMVLEYLEPATQKGKGSFTISAVGSFFKQVGIDPTAAQGFGDSDPCQINVNCSPVGNNWQDEKRGVARILVTSNGSSGWCTGSLVNNTAQDCKAYFLTALHCGDNSTTADFNQYIFYFNYEFSGCSNSSAPTPNTLTGAALRAEANDLSSSSTSSDFMLLELNSAIPASYNVYYNGWNIATSTSGGGVGIHHPAGDVKKISTYTATPSNVGVTWNGNSYSVGAGSTHWSFAWSANANGHGVTEGGSSGSPMFNNVGEIIGTLSGGGSYCNAQNSSDQYGKMSYHWQSNAAATNKKLKPWLDPTNSGLSSLAGTYAPCATISPNDAGIFAISQPTATVCGTTISPEIDLKNYGTANLSTVTIRYQINSGTLYTYNWTGNLAQNATTTVTLNAINTPAGTNTISVFTQNPNGVTDGNTANDSKTETYDVNTTLALPLIENFEAASFPNTNFLLSNSDNDKTWEQTTSSSFGTGTKSMYIDNWDYNAAGQYDWFLTPTYDFSSSVGATLTYDLAYAYYEQTNGSGLNYDTLGIAVSTDCGNSYYWLWKQGGTQLATAGGLGVEFIPSNSDWTNKTLDLSVLDNETSVQFAFIAINGYGNNLYIDNINISNVVSNVPVAAFTANSTSVCPGASISFTDQTTNTPTAWSWSFAGATPSTSTAQNPTVSYPNPGNYTVTLIATNADGSDSETKLNYITVNANPSLSFSNTAVNCFNGNDGTATVIPTGNGGFSYNWTSGGNLATISNLSVGTYSCTVTDANNCSTSGATTISQPSTAVSVSASVTDAVCGNANGSVSPSATGGTGSYTYTYSNGGNGSNLAAGTYTVTATDANNCSATTSFTVGNTNTALNLNLSATNITCFNGNDGSITALASGSSAYTFAWSNSSNTSASLSNLSSGTYTCTVTDGSGCTASQTITLTQASEIVLSLNTSTAYCNNANGSVSATATGGVGPYTYSFSNGNSNLSPGTYTCTVTDASLCTKTASFTIANTDQNFSINVSSTPSSCTGNTGTASAAVVGGISAYTFAWDNGQTTAIATGLSFGNHHVTLTNPNGCSETANFTVSNSNAPTISVQTTAVDCPGFATGNATVNISGGTPDYNITWSSSNNTNNTESNLAAGNYTVTVVDDASCAALENFSISEPEAFTVSIATENEHCDTKDGQLVATATGGTPNYNYAWSNGTSGNVLVNQSAGSYTINVTDQNNCSTQATASIQNIAAASISNIIVSDVSCAEANDGSIQVDLSGGTGSLSSLWSNGETTTNISNLAGGTYALSVTDAENCITDTSIIVNEPDALAIILSIVDNSPAAPSVITANATGGSGIYNFLWSTGSNAQTINNLATGTYNLNISDSKNCSADTSINIGNVSIQNTDWIQDVSIYPNPTSQNIQLHLDLIQLQNIKLSVVNTVGQKVFEKQLIKIQSTTETIPSNTYASGVYYIQLETATAKSIYKFVKLD